jgi:hypothetical protein
MNQEVKARWVAALRSGEYKQTKEYLQSEDGFCCLGVLCEIAVQDGVVSAVDDTTPAVGGYKNVKRYGPEISFLPMAVQQWAELGSHAPRVNIRPGYNHSLVDLNDDLGWDFQQIANIIEEQV